MIDVILYQMGAVGKRARRRKRAAKARVRAAQEQARAEAAARGEAAPRFSKKATRKAVRRARRSIRRTERTERKERRGGRREERQLRRERRRSDRRGRRPGAAAVDTITRAAAEADSGNVRLDAEVQTPEVSALTTGSETSVERAPNRLPLYIGLSVVGVVGVIIWKRRRKR